MCLIIHKKHGVPLKNDVLIDMLNYNTDGWGVMYFNRRHGKVVVRKGFDRNKLLDIVDDLGDKAEILVHGRQRTHGVVGLANNHPFEIGTSGVWMMHNGVIPKLTHGTHSDTALFADHITDLVEVNPDVILTEGFRFLVEHRMGNSRLAFMLPNGEVKIITDRKWVEYEGLHMSNDYAWSLHGNWSAKRGKGQTWKHGQGWTSRPEISGGSHGAATNPTTTQTQTHGGTILTTEIGGDEFGRVSGEDAQPFSSKPGKIYPYYSSNQTLYSGDPVDFTEVAEPALTFPKADGEYDELTLQSRLVSGSLLEDGTVRRVYSDGMVVYTDPRGKIRVTTEDEERRRAVFHANLLQIKEPPVFDDHPLLIQS